MTMAYAELRKFVSPEVLFGQGARDLAGPYARRIGMTKALVVTDPGVIDAGWVAPLVANLLDNGVVALAFSDVRPNPSAEQVMNGAAAYRDGGCDSIVAVGGGSPMDCAKGVGVVVSNGGHVLDYEGVDLVETPMPPLVCVPTTAGSGADVSQFAIISDPRRRIKTALVSKSLVPDLALVDPVPLTTMDPTLTAATGLDALTHAVEAYVSNASWPLTDELALAAMRRIPSALKRCIADGEDIEARAEMALASLDAGLAFSNASLGAVHALAHALGGLLDMPHGECNALLLGPVMRRTLALQPADRVESMAAALGVRVGSGPAADVAQWLTEFPATVGLAFDPDAWGLTASAIPGLVNGADSDVCLATNPWDATPDDLSEILRDALA